MKSRVLDGLSAIGIALLFLFSIAFSAFGGCATLTNPGAVTSTQQTVANAVEDAISIGLVPVLTKNPSYIGAAQTVAAGLGAFSGSTITPADVNAFLAKVPQITPADARVIAGIVNAAWATYSKRYAQQVGANVRPDVKLFLDAVASGIGAAIAATPK
jgi:hypothetical protein